ncbi:MAG TPA: Gfo/Idh/MocA family oxidoreductase [Candidatus Limnocylindrales bacterium]
MTGDRLRLGLIGAGWITQLHLAALDRLGRTTLVGVSSASLASAEATAGPRGAAAYDDVERMLDEQRPDIVFVAVPPSAAVATCEAVLARAIPFLTEKPLAATDAEGPARLAAATIASGLVVAVGYQLRSLERLPEVRARLAANPARLVTARWTGATPPPAWWRRERDGGGQVIEQATHLFDLARLLVGEAEVVGAASLRETPATPPDTDVADASAAVLRFASGAVGAFANTRRQSSAVVDISFSSDGQLTTIRKASPDPLSWEVEFRDGSEVTVLPPGCDPYEIQAEAFLDAVVAGDPTAVPSTYADAFLTDRLTRAVVAATGAPG